MKHPKNASPMLKWLIRYPIFSISHFLEENVFIHFSYIYPAGAGRAPAGPGPARGRTRATLARRAPIFNRPHIPWFRTWARDASQGQAKKRNKKRILVILSCGKCLPACNQKTKKRNKKIGNRKTYHPATEKQKSEMREMPTSL